MELFDRTVELKVGNTYITDLHIAFEIEKDLTPEPNFCQLEIYNLSEKNRLILSNYDRVPILLKAGFQGNNKILFQGDMLRCFHTKEDCSWKTTMSSGDGVKALQTSRINKSFAKDTPIKTVIKEIAKQLNLTCDSTLNQFENLTEKLTRGFIASGNPMDELGRILKEHGCTASVQNNSLQILQDKEPLLENAISLTARSGLKNTPEQCGKMIKVQSVLMPQLLPGTRIHVESSGFNRFAVIQSIRFEGSNFGDNWNADIVGKIC